MTKEELIAFEANLARRWEAGEIKAPLHLCGGNEDQLIEIFKEIKRDDYIFSSHRNHYHALLHGCDAGDLLDEILGSEDGTCHGHARSMGFINSSRNFYSSAIVGGCCAVAVGVAWGLKEKKSANKVWCFVGDGAVDGGHFWEALQYTFGYNLPLTFIVEHNDRATCTSVADRLGEDRMRFAHDNVRMYRYKAIYPHVGTGKYVQF